MVEFHQAKIRICCKVSDGAVVTSDLRCYEMTKCGVTRDSMTLVLS